MERTISAREEMGCDGRLREEIGTAQEEMGCDERG